MKPETKAKIVGVLDRLETITKGGPGSGPHPGMGHGGSTREEAAEATKVAHKATIKASNAGAALKGVNYQHNSIYDSNYHSHYNSKLAKNSSSPFDAANHHSGSAMFHKTSAENILRHGTDAAHTAAAKLHTDAAALQMHAANAHLNSTSVQELHDYAAKRLGVT